MFSLTEKLKTTYTLIIIIIIIIIIKAKFKCKCSIWLKWLQKVTLKGSNEIKLKLNEIKTIQTFK